MIELRGSGELRRIATALRQIDNPELKKRFRRELRAAAQPLVPVVKASIWRIPSKTGSGQLRTEMVRATRVESRTTGRHAGVAIRVDGRKMPPGKRRLPSYMEGSRKPWRHPVFGNREVWVTQKPNPYFYKVVRPAGLAARRAVNRVLDGVTREIS